jgi:ketosteroid isomerase-like protein
MHNRWEESMKTRFLLALVGLAVSFALPTYAQENDTVDPQSRQELEAVDTKLDQAIDKNDAAAAAALFTEDAILMLPLEFAPERSGIFSGRAAIEKWYTQKFTEYHVTDSKGKLDQIHAVDNGMWAVGTYTHTVNFRRTPGYRAIFFVRVGHSYQIRKMFIEW